MSWMKEIAILIEEARMVGADLELSDFRRDGDTLTLDGIPVDEWFDNVVRDYPDEASESFTTPGLGDCPNGSPSCTTGDPCIICYEQA